MNKYSVLAIFLSILSGLFVGSYLANRASEPEIVQLKKEKRELEKKIREDLHVIDSISTIVVTLDRVVKIDSAIIETLKQANRAQDIIIQHQRDEAAKLTPSQKRDWLINRYRQSQR